MGFAKASLSEHTLRKSMTGRFQLALQVCGDVGLPGINIAPVVEDAVSEKNQGSSHVISILVAAVCRYGAMA